MSDQKWTKVITGILLGLGTYGVVKWVKKEKWTLKGAFGSVTVGGIGFPLTEPAIRKIIEGIKNLPPTPVSTSPIRQDKPPNLATTEKEKLLIEKLEDLEKKLTGMYQTTKNQERPLLSENKWEAILIPGSIILIIGERGSGKTALGYYLLQKLCQRMGCYVVNLPDKVRRLLPAGIGAVATLEEAPCHTALLVDEAGLEFSARKSASERNQRLLEVISLARQRNQIIIFIVQETSYIDITILRGLSSLIVKEPSPLQSRLERPEIREFIEKAQVAFNQVPGDKRDWAYLAFGTSGKHGMLRTPKPSFFCHELSNCYGLSYEKIAEKKPSILSREDKKEKAYEMHTKEKLSIRKIAEQLGVGKSTVHNLIKEKGKEMSEAFDRLVSQFGQIGKN